MGWMETSGAGKSWFAIICGFERLAHLQYIPMPGGSAAIVEPRRMAISYLFHHFGRDFWDLDIPFVRGLDRRRTETLLRLIERGVNSPLTSSAGRLFDAVAAVAGVREHVNYEAQAAIELEAAIEDTGEGSGYPFAIRKEGSGWIIDTRPMFLALAQDTHDGVPTGVVSLRFHLGFVDVLARMAELVRERTGLDRDLLKWRIVPKLFSLRTSSHAAWKRMASRCSLTPRSPAATAA